MVFKFTETPSRIERRINEEDKEELSSLPVVDDIDYSGVTSSYDNESLDDENNNRNKFNSVDNRQKEIFRNLVDNDQQQSYHHIDDIEDKADDHVSLPDVTNVVTSTPNTTINNRSKSHFNSSLKQASASPFMNKSTPRPNPSRHNQTPKPVLMSAMKDKSKYNGTPFAKTVSFSRQPQALSFEDPQNQNNSVSLNGSSNNGVDEEDLTTPIPNNSSNNDDTETKFDSSKLNNYLHTLNRHLENENEQLMQALEEARLEIEDQKNNNNEDILNENYKLKQMLEDSSKNSQGQNDKLVRTIDKVNDDYGILKSKYKELEVEYNKLKIDFDGVYNDKIYFEDLCKKLEQESQIDRENFEREFKELNADNEELEERLNSNNNEVAEKYNILRNSKEELERKYNDLLNEQSQHRQQQLTPNSKFGSINGTPAIHKSVINLRMPKTPATPEWLGHDTWLNQTTIGAGDVQPLLMQVAALRKKLDGANDEVDSNLRKLGDAGLDKGQLLNQLVETKERVMSLETELERVYDGQHQDRQSIDDLINERDKLISLNDKLQEDIEIKEDRMVKMESKLNDYINLRRRFESKVEECRRLEREKIELEDEGRLTHEELAKQDSEINRMNEEFIIIGRDLDMLKNERDGLELRRKESQMKLRDEIKRLESQQSSNNNEKFDKEKRGLGIEIRYQKDKMKRERMMREDLVCQKKYLLLLVGGLRLTQDATIAAISKIGFMDDNPKSRSQGKRKVHKFKTTVFCIMATIRMKNARQRWLDISSKRNELVMRRS